jgi:hypothetical protein
LGRREDYEPGTMYQTSEVVLKAATASALMFPENPSNTELSQPIYEGPVLAYTR